VSGKQKSVECIGLVLRVLSQGRPQEGESAHRKLLDPLTRRADGSSPNRMSGEGRWRPSAARRLVLAAEVPGQRPVPERNGAQASRSNVTGKARRVILSGAERRRVCAAEMPCGSAEAGRGFDTTEGASSRSSIFSRQRRWLL